MHICDLRERIECEPLSEYSTRSDRVTNMHYLLLRGVNLAIKVNQKTTTTIREIQL